VFSREQEARDYLGSFGLGGKPPTSEAAAAAAAAAAALFPVFSREQEARDYLGSFGLGGKPSMIPLRMLSGGQKARAALALLLATRPHLLLLDGTSHPKQEALQLVQLSQ
jgi:ATPase subunit of ABC transporter with duplicated ATPase domains